MQTNIKGIKKAKVTGKEHINWARKTIPAKNPSSYVYW